MIINIAILDDNVLKQSELELLLKRWCSSAVGVSKVNSIKFDRAEDLLSIDYMTLDAIFLDVKSSTKINGLECAKRMREKGYGGKIAFTINHGEYPLEGYIAEATALILKPFKKNQIYDFMNVVQKEVVNTYYIYKYNYETILIPHKEIIYCSSYMHYINIITSRGIYKQKKSISKMEEILPKYFLRCHRTIIVNTKNIEVLSPKIIKMKNGDELPVSLNKREELYSAYVKKL